MREITPAEPASNTAEWSLEKFREQWLKQIALDKELPAGALRLCIAMSTHMNRYQSSEAWPGMRRLARETGLSRRYIADLTQLVEERGHWKVARSKVGRKNIVNRYRPILCTAVHQGSELATSPPSELATS